jgi:serine/threonine protein kinase/tetratricopeptide (TPR) repeat protein
VTGIQKNRGGSVAIDRKVSELLEELHDSGLTPEEVCVDFPELLPELRERWCRVCRLEAELDAIFPPEREETHPTSAGEIGNLPQIPGYELEGLLGRGGMGVVFRARHLKLNRVVAIKLAIAGAYAAPRERERFQREAEAVAALHHPQVVQIYDVGDSEGRPYYTMEFISGGSLAEKEKPTTPREAALLIRSVAGAVQAAHIGGIIHRDLKPANILIEDGGTPKVADFGLSRRLDETTSLTLHGAVIGTPSYMAPEQAAGDRDILGPAVDIYALGAILYELLTARPPFRAGTPAETVRLVVNAEPIPPTRLNVKVPRDLEVICLKCLNKNPARRYFSAEALGADLRRFLDGEAIEARPEGRLGRLARQIRQRPVLTAFAVCGFAVAMSLIGGGLWIFNERSKANQRREAEMASIERSAADDLRDMVRWFDKQSWAPANAALERAKLRLGGGGSSQIRRAINQGSRDLAMAKRLDDIRIDRARTVGGIIDNLATQDAYLAAFATYGVGGPDETPEIVASRIRASNIRWALIDAVDAWSSLLEVVSHKEWLLRVARLSDRDEAGWIADARDPAFRNNRAGLVKLGRSAPFADPRVSLLLAVAGDLWEVGGDAETLLTKVQRSHPGDFWANLQLSFALRDTLPAESVRYGQAAVSIRPDAAYAHNALGNSFLAAGRKAEAIECYRCALKLDPSAPMYISNVAFILRGTGKNDESIELLRKALETHPRSSLLRAGLGHSLAAAGKLVQAEAEYRDAIAIDPKSPSARKGLRILLCRLGRLDEAKAGWRVAIDADPKDFETWDEYAELCLFLGHESDYLSVRRELMARFGELTNARVAERVGRACLLLPASEDEEVRAAALIDRAIADAKTRPVDWTYRFFMFAKGLAEYRLGRFESAISFIQGAPSTALGPCPLLVTAMAEYRLGRGEKARKTLASAIGSFDWQGTKADNRETWLYHILRREAEATVQGRQSTRDEVTHEK